MATITSDTYLDGGIARTAGEAWICNGGRLTIRTDSRWHANAPASMTGSLGAVTISSSLGGGYTIDGTNVRWLAYGSGSGNVPAIGTSVTQGGVTSSYLLGVWASMTSAPTAVGSAMPASGYLKFREVSGAFASGALTGIGASATGADVVGWIEVVHDQAIAITVPRLGDFTVRGAWFDLGTTSGSANQVIQLPTNGSSTTYVQGLWIANVASPSTDDDYDFYPSLYVAGMTTTNLGTDERSKFVSMETNGSCRIGHNGTTTVGYIPPSGRAIRVPNVFGRQCTTAARATNAIPNATAATRPDFATTSAGAIDCENFMTDWYMYFLQPYSVRLQHLATFDYVLISECATAVDLYDGGNGISQSLDARTLNITSCFAGGTIEKWTCHRFAAGTTDHACENIYSIGQTYTNVKSGIVTFARSTGMSFQITQSSNITFNNCYSHNQAIQFTTSFDCTVNDHNHCDRYVGTTNTTGIYAVYILASSENVLVDGFTFGYGGTIANVHPYLGVFNIGQSKNITLRNLGTRSSYLSGGSANNPAYIFVSAGNNQNVKVQRCYMTPTRTGAISTLNSDKGNTYEHVYGDMTDTMVVANLNSHVKNCGGTNTTTGQASVYGTHFWDAFTSDTAGRVILSLNEATAETSTYVTIVSLATGSGFTSAGNLSLAVVGDEVIIAQDYFVLGCTALTNTAPVVTGTNVTYSSGARWGNHDIYYQIDTGNGWNGTWKDLTAVNLFGETVNASVGFKLKYRMVCATAAVSNLLTYIRIVTTSTLASQTSNLYPLDLATFTLSNVVAGSVYEIYNLTSSTTLAVGTAGSSTVIATAVASNGDSIRVRVRKASTATKYIPFETQSTVAASAASVFVSQVADSIAAISVNATIAGDFTVDTTNKTIKHTADSVVYTANELYTWLMNYFDDSDLMDDTVPMSAQTPTEYSLINGWFMDDESFKYLKSGAIQTEEWTHPTNATGIRILTLDAVEGLTTDDIGNTVAGVTTGDTGKLLAYNTTDKKLWVRSDATDDLFDDDDESITVDSVTCGNMTAVSASGENIWSNIFTLGTLVSGTTMDVYQNDVQITPWWTSGQIDILVKVKETGVEIDSGNITVLAREYSTLYDHFVIDASTGRNPVPLAAFTDKNNQTAEETVSGYGDVTITFSASSQDLGNGNGSRPYDVLINCAGRVLTQAYEYLKYVTRTGSSTTLNGVNGEYYVAVGGIRFDYDNEAGGPFEEGELITGTGGVSPTGYLVSLIDNGVTGTMVLRNVHGTFTDDQEITGGTSNATADINGTLDSITPSKQAPFGTFAGGNFFGARGVWIYNIHANDANKYQLIDSTNTSQSPSLTVPIVVDAIESGDCVSVFRADGDSNTVDKTYISSHATSNSSPSTSWQTTASIPADTPETGIIRLVKAATGTEERIGYTSWSGDTFSLSSSHSGGYGSGDHAYVPYIDEEATGTSVSKNVTYFSDRYVTIRVRKKGIIPFIIKKQLTNAGMSVSAIRLPDSIVQ